MQIFPRKINRRIVYHRGNRLIYHFRIISFSACTYLFPLLLLRMHMSYRLRNERNSPKVFIPLPRSRNVLNTGITYKCLYSWLSPKSKTCRKQDYVGEMEQRNGGKPSGVRKPSPTTIRVLAGFFPFSLSLSRLRLVSLPSTMNKSRSLNIFETILIFRRAF